VPAAIPSCRFGPGHLRHVLRGLGGHGQQRRGPQPGPDAEISLEITLDDAAFGATKEVNVTLAHRLQYVRRIGLRARNLTDDVRGVRRRGRRATSAQFDSRPDGDLDALHALQRHGITNRLAVPDCRGDGRRNESTTLTIQVPAGVEDGSTMRLSDRGPAGLRGDRTVDSSCTFACRPIVASNVTATTCTTRRTSLHPGGSWARRSRCRRCARHSRWTWRREAPTGPSTDFATRASSTCTGAAAAISTFHLVSKCRPNWTTPPRASFANSPNIATSRSRGERRTLPSTKSEEVSLLEWPRRVAAVAQFRVDDPNQPTLNATDEHHLRTVLRARSGEELVVTDGAGAWSLCEVGDHALHRVTPVHIDPPSPSTTLYLSPLKGDRSE